MIAIKKIYLVIRKDWLEIRKSAQTSLSLVLVPLIFGIIVPIVLFLLFPDGIELFATFFSILPFQPQLPSYIDEAQKGIVFLVALLNLFFLILPLMLPASIAVDSIAGEKERKTLESLLLTPMTDLEILLGKILMPIFPATIIMWITAVPYILIVDFFTFPKIGGLLLPDLSFLMMIFLLAPAISFFNIVIMVIISAKIGNTRDAQYVAGFLFLPVMGFLIGQILFALFSPFLILLGIFIFLIIDYGVLRVALRLFDRENLVVTL
ncbi:MAG: ABC transporter permease subunit [Promethearchaeota archaeon]